MWNYTDTVLDHFVNPRNVGEIEDANAIGQVGSLACGDALKLFLKVDPESELILEAKFKTFGCASAIASASALTEMVRGKTLTEAEKISNNDIAKFLGGLPEQKMHCSVMGREALEAAIANFRGASAPEHKEDEAIICKCFWVSEDKIRKNIQDNNLKTVDEITNFTKAGGGCGGCLPDLKRILKEVTAYGDGSAETVGKKKGMNTVQRIAAIQKVIIEDIAPSLAADGGSVELMDVNGNQVVVSLAGACSRCAGAKFTLQNLVQGKLREKIDPEIIVVEE